MPSVGRGKTLSDEYVTQAATRRSESQGPGGETGRPHDGYGHQHQ